MGAVAPIFGVVVEEQPPFAPVEHVGGHDHVAAPRQGRRDAVARIDLSLEVGQRGVLVVGLYQFLLTP